MELGVVVALASIALTALIARYSYRQTQDRNRQDLITSEQERRHQLDMARNNRYQARVEGLYVEVELYARRQFQVAHELFMESEGGPPATTDEEPEEDPSARAKRIEQEELFTSRTSLYGSSRVIEALKVFHAHLGQVYFLAGAARADAGLKQILRDARERGDPHDKEAEFDAARAARKQALQEGFEALWQALDDLGETMRSDLAA